MKEVRISNNMTQDDLADNIVTRKTLAKIENNQISPTLEILTQLFNRLGFELSELNHMLKNNFEHTYHNLKNEFIRLLQTSETVCKNEWINFEKKLSNEKKSNQWVLNLYLVFKSRFEDSDFIAPLTDLEISDIQDQLLSKSIHSLTDYKILGNLTTLIPFEIIEMLYSHLFPVKLPEIRNDEFNQVVIQAYNNILTQTIKYEWHIKTKYYLNEVRKEPLANSDYLCKLQIFYLEQLSLFSETGNPIYNSKAFYYANIAKDLGDNLHYESLVAELEKFSNKTITLLPEIKMPMIKNKLINPKPD
ncbi:helix-turn-helix domain-containing protein [Carnobacterium maltaromaticum]|uniref:helix-turn-helix domain-containing protein n=1 Tax=Carnobacterium maltaromaticum TaxID=2751 RepID=UPI0039BE6061